MDEVLTLLIRTCVNAILMRSYTHAYIFHSVHTEILKLNTCGYFPGYFTFEPIILPVSDASLICFINQ